ncbi:MAG: IS110 family transposase, partial [Nostoc sp.]
VQSPIMNRARQDLAWQFPEVALVKSRRGESGEPPLLWGWLAGIRKSTRYARLYEKTVGLGITQTVREHAKRICDLQHEEHVIEGELRKLLADPRFDHYRTVFKMFGFGDRLSSVIISQIYPI